MERRTRQIYEARARVVKALAHPARLFMVDRLAEGEFCVCELARMVGSDMSTVSRHLAQLREAGIVEDEKRGTQVFYRLAMPCVLKLFECVEPVLQARGRAYREAVEA
jgi:ArsR family transcriptional regulator